MNETKSAVIDPAAMEEVLAAEQRWHDGEQRVVTPTQSPQVSAAALKERVLRGIRLPTAEEIGIESRRYTVENPLGIAAVSPEEYSSATEPGEDMQFD